MIVFNLLLGALFVALVAGIFLRFWTKTLPPVVFAQVTPPHAAEIVSSFLEGVSETRFGFPSGVFRVNEAKSEAETRVTVQEQRPGYSVTDGCAMASTAAGVGFLADADGCLEACLAMLAVVFIAGPIWVLNLTEKGFRRLLESEVTADFEPVTDPEGTLVTIRLRGMSAILLSKAYEDALSTPKLPDDIAIAAGVTPPSTQSETGSVPE